MNIQVHGVPGNDLGAFMDGPSITVDHNADNPPHVVVCHSSDTDRHSLAVVYAAGAAASARYARTSTARELLNGGAEDLVSLRKALPDPDEQLAAIAKADLLVRETWPVIRELARELRQRGTMTMNDVHDWLRAKQVDSAPT